MVTEIASKNKNLQRKIFVAKSKICQLSYTFRFTLNINSQQNKQNKVRKRKKRKEEEEKRTKVEINKTCFKYLVRD
jgi:hypothetical protein